MKYILTLFLALMFLTACEDETTFIIPESGDNHISFLIAGEQQSLRSFNDNNINFLEPASGRLFLVNKSSDGGTILTINGYGLPVVDRTKGASFDSEGFAPVTIRVEGRNMSGSVYCPHPDVTNYVEYKGLFRWDSYDENNRMKGRFMTDPAEDNPAEITEGVFELIVIKD